MLAPVWWIDDVGQAYGAAKYLNVLVMTAAVFPTYGLARMVVSKPWALFAAAGAGMIPASTTRRCSSRSRSRTPGRSPRT